MNEDNACEMQSEDENECDKTFISLSNVFHESGTNELQFENFLIDENSESEQIDFAYSEDNSNILDEDTRNTDIISNDSISVSESCSLGFENWNTVNSLQTSNLEDLIKLNRQERHMLLQSFHKIKEHLKVVQERIRILQKNVEKTIEKGTPMFLSETGAPFFKTKKNRFSPNPNPDSLCRKAKGILQPVYQSCYPLKWSKSECENLIRGVKLTYNLNKQKAVLKKISSSRREIEFESDPSTVTQKKYDIEKWEGEIRNLKALGINDTPPLCDDEFIDWFHIAAEYLNDKHTAQECCSFWRIYLHPSINKSNWSKDENRRIRELAIKYNEQGWDEIAEELCTSRSGFTVYIHYATSLHETLSSGRFTQEEDQLILQLVEQKKNGNFIPWNSIAESFPKRTKAQLMNRYKLYLRDKCLYNSEFSDAEDVLILHLVERFGRNYIQFTKYLPRKSYVQIKSRYNNHLRCRRIKGAFTLEEDRQILNHFDDQPNGITTLGEQMNRNRMQLRQRYKIIEKFLQQNPHKSLEDMPRRIVSTNEDFRRFAFLKYVVDLFKDQVNIPTLSEIESKIGKNKKGSDLDKLLVDFFNTSYAFKQRTSETPIHKIKLAAEQIYSITKFFGITLQIPEEICKNNTLDIVDVEILNLLRQKECTDAPKTVVHELFPPNINSLLGLRGLLMKNQKYKKSKNKRNLQLEQPIPTTQKNNNLYSELTQILESKDQTTQTNILKERDLFSNLFQSMFMWPALLSIETPNEKLLKNDSRPAKSQTIKDINSENKKITTKRKRQIIPIKSPVKKKPKTIIETKPHETMQPIRSSSRLKKKREISEEEETIIQQPEVAPIDNRQPIVANTIESHKAPGISVVETANKKTKGSSCIKTIIPTKNVPIIPSNLVRVDKSEVMKHLQNNKRIKIIRIQTPIKQNMIAEAQPSTMQIIHKMKQAEKDKNLESSRVIINNKISISKSQNHNLPSNTSLNLDEMKKNVSNSMRTIEKNKTPFEKEISKKNNDAEDINKLDLFLNANSNELMKKEIDQLDELIKQADNSNVI